MLRCRGGRFSPLFIPGVASEDSQVIQVKAFVFSRCLLRLFPSPSCVTVGLPAPALTGPLKRSECSRKGNEQRF